MLEIPRFIMLFFSSALLGTFSVPSLNDNTILPDYLHIKRLFTHGHIISNSFMELLKKYDSDVNFRPIFFTNIKMNKQYLYWQVKEKPIFCLKETGFIKKILPISEIKEKRFLIAGIGKAEFMVVDTYLMESILRRNPIGIKFKELDYI